MIGNVRVQLYAPTDVFIVSACVPNPLPLQAISDKVEVSSQTTWVKPCNAAVQYSARTLPPEQAQIEEGGEEGGGEGMAEFLHRAVPRLELALQQNNILDMFVDDYRALSDSDVITGNKSDSNLKEYQSFTDLKFSKDKSILWIDWHPAIKGRFESFSRGAE